MAADAFIGYDELDGAVTRLKLGIAPAELHGSLCGFLAGGGQVGQQPLVEALHMDAEISPSAPDDALLRDLVKQSEAELADPMLGNRRMKLGDFLRSWPSHAVFVVIGSDFDRNTVLLQPDDTPSARSLYARQNPITDAELLDFGFTHADLF